VVTAGHAIPLPEVPEVVVVGDPEFGYSDRSGPSRSGSILDICNIRVNY
jgi:hypothetical protein